MIKCQVFNLLTFDITVLYFFTSVTSTDFEVICRLFCVFSDDVLKHSQINSTYSLLTIFILPYKLCKLLKHDHTKKKLE